jgi:protein-S-isoprenylcysteine O-methyltransferase Ste14
VAGAVVIWVGLALRVWAVLTLGRSFSTFIQVDADQAVVTRGPRWVRHPSYTGLLLIALGFGLGVGNWLSLAVCALIPLVGLLPRIAAEEAELTRVLDDQYRGIRRQHVASCRDCVGSRRRPCDGRAAGMADCSP